MTRPSDEGRCDICGEPMPEGESMFRMHGYSGPCPKPPLPAPPVINWELRALAAERDLAAAKATIRRLAISSVTANPGVLHHYKCAACGGRWSGRPTDAEQHAAGCDAAIAGSKE